MCSGHRREGRNAAEGDGMDCVRYAIGYSSEAGWGDKLLMSQCRLCRGLTDTSHTDRGTLGCFSFQAFVWPFNDPAVDKTAPPLNKDKLTTTDEAEQPRRRQEESPPHKRRLDRGLCIYLFPCSQRNAGLSIPPPWISIDKS